MTKSKIVHTSESLKAQDTDLENYHYQLDDGEKYQLTEAEIGWLDFVKGKYCIADHIIENSEENEKGKLVYTMDTMGLSEALKNDDCTCKAVCLSDDTTLQAIFFYSSTNQ